MTLAGSVRTSVLVAAMALAFVRVGLAQNAAGVGMPDPRQMSGIPLPVTDVPNGTVTVRIIKGSLVNAVPNHPVELHVDGRTLRATTDARGRAAFSGLAAGASARASAAVGGEKLESQEFQVPGSGGIRLMLVATDPNLPTGSSLDAAPSRGPAQPGAVVLGEQSRFVIELSDDALSVFNILPIVNAATNPVQTTQPVVFELPDGAQGAAVLEGSSPQATVQGNRVIVGGPFAPGTTLVQFGYSLPYSGHRVVVEQRMPVQLMQLAVLAQKVGDMHLASPQLAAQRDMTAEGQTYVVAQGPGIKAGDALTLTLTGLPHAPTWPRNVALALAVVILVAGAWGSARGVRGASALDGRRAKLHQRRDRLFEELTSLEEQHTAGRVSADNYASRRRDLVAALERVYGEIDEEATA